jgi:O-antigen/teichoic acid export membrane protein
MDRDTVSHVSSPEAISSTAPTNYTSSPERHTPGRALSSGAVYAAAAALQRAIGFLLLPLYTRALDPSEYGALSVLVSIASVVAILFTFALDIAIFRTYFEYEDHPAAQQRYLDSIWRFLIAAPIAGALLAAALAWPFADRLGVGGLDVLLAFVGVAVWAAATTVPQSVLRAQQRLRDYLKLTAVATVATPVLTVAFVVVLDGGITGWFLAVGLTALMSLVASMWILPWHPQSPFDPRMVRRSLRFSLPLLPHILSHWALQLADRLVLVMLVSSSAVGIYTLAATMALPVMIAVQSLNQGFMPTYARAGWKPEAVAVIERTVVIQVAIVASGALGGALLGPPLVETLAAEEYSAAAALVPWIALGYGFLGLYYIPMNGATLMAGRSGFAWVATAVSAAANLGLLLLLVPAYGIKAAAIASAIGYLVLLVTISVYADARPNPIRYRWSEIVPIIVAATGVYALAAATSPTDPILALAVRSSWLVALALCVWLAWGLLSRLRRSTVRPVI